MKALWRSAAVEKIEEQRKPEDFIGHRKRGGRRTLIRLALLGTFPQGKALRKVIDRKERLKAWGD